jgi:hypothetical protein
MLRDVGYDVNNAEPRMLTSQVSAPKSHCQFSLRPRYAVAV